MKAVCVLRFGEWSPPSASELGELKAEFANDVDLVRALAPAQREHVRLRLLRLLPEDLAPDVNAAFEAAAADEPLSEPVKKFLGALARLAVKASMGRSASNSKIADRTSHEDQ